jgi:ribonuclease Y
VPANVITYVLDFLVALAGAAAVCAYWVANRRRIAAETVGRAEEQARAILREAEREADTRRKEALLEAKERAHDLRVEAEQFARDHRQQITGIEQILARREASLVDQQQTLERRMQTADRREREQAQREERLAAEETRCETLAESHRRELEQVAALTRDEARVQLLKEMEADARREAAALITRVEHDAREQAADKARAIITQAIQRSAAEHTVETTVTVVDLPSDEMKGRIIGREGRNIRALEVATGVDLIVDDTPGAIILSGFDPWRREVARLAIERLIADGRIHPARIEEVVEAVKSC